MFGAVGDLARRKLLPSLYQLDKAGLVNPETRIIGAGREGLTSDGYINQARESLERFMKETIDREVWERFVKQLHYVRVEMNRYDQYSRLGDVVDQEKRVMVNYLALPARHFHR
jgi:glucose-6-phosphate 1-dehydrogenase